MADRVQTDSCGFIKPGDGESNQSRAAKILGIARETLYRKLQQMEL